MEEEKSCNTHLYSFLRTRKIWEGKNVIFPISHELVGILNSVFLPCLMNKRVWRPINLLNMNKITANVKGGLLSSLFKHPCV